MGPRGQSKLDVRSFAELATCTEQQLVSSRMAKQRFEIDVDPNFEIHTSHHNDFFLLRTKVLVNGKNTEIRSVKEGPVLNFCYSGSTISTKLSSISNTILPTLVDYGVYHVNLFYHEQSPLFHVIFSSESCMKNFIFANEEVTSVLESQLQSLLSSNLKTESVEQPTVKVHLDLFLVSPGQKLTKGAEVRLVTADNCSTSATRWKLSKLFDFGPLCQEEGVCHIQTLALPSFHHSFHQVMKSGNMRVWESLLGVSVCGINLVWPCFVYCYFI